MKREMQKRDDIILRGRDEHSRLHKELVDEMQATEKRLTDEIDEIENVYEKKLTQESLYLDKMRQAFDEVVVHSRMDAEEAQQVAIRREEEIWKSSQGVVSDAERQKAMVLTYVNYVKARHEEVLNGLVASQESER